MVFKILTLPFISNKWTSLIENPKLNLELFGYFFFPELELEIFSSNLFGRSGAGAFRLQLFLLRAGAGASKLWGSTWSRLQIGANCPSLLIADLFEKIPLNWSSFCLKSPLFGLKSCKSLIFTHTHKAESYSKISLITEYFQIKVDFLNVRNKILEQV